MKKSVKVTLHLVPTIAIAVLASGCSPDTPPQPTHVKTCVDQTETVVAEQQCDQEENRLHPAGAVYYPRWYYYMNQGNVYPLGSRVSGGSYVRPSVAPSSISRPSSITRGGFGSIGSGHSSVGS